MSEGAEKPEPDKATKTESGGIAFLDFMFTVAISLGLTPELLNGERNNLRGMLSERWVEDRLNPGPGDWFNLAVLGLGLVTTVFSWFGYHRSVLDKPIRYETIRGMLRFSLDVVLIILYGLALIFFKTYALVAGILAWIFWIYFVWGILRFSEHRSEYGPIRMFLRLPLYEWIPALWAVIVTFAWILGIASTLDQPWPSWGLALFGVVGFRVHKRIARVGQTALLQ